MNLSQIEGLATSLSGPTSAIAAAANLGDKALTLIEPFVFSLVKTQDELLHQDIKTATDIVNAPDSIDRGHQLVKFTDDLFVRGECPIVDGGPNLTVIGIGGQRLLSLLALALKGVYAEQTIRAMADKASGQTPTVPSLIK